MQPGETQALLDHLITSAHRGFPLTRQGLREAALAILKKRLGEGVYLGKNWCTRFLQRHSTILKTHWGQTLDIKRGQAVNPATNETYFRLLKEVLGVKEDGSVTILPENIYGCDESGFMQGVAETERVIGLAGKSGQHVMRYINRETTTALVTICADGTSLPPLVIFKGKHFQLQWNQNNPLGCSLAYSDNGWATQELGVGFLKIFIAQTEDKCQGRTRVLLVDGHTSHCTYAFLKLAAEHNIIVLCYPPHATHVYQGLDVACFGLMKQYWRTACQSYELGARERVSKAMFLQVFAEPYRKAFTVETIKSAFKRTGVVPYDPTVITADMLAPSKATS
ncbi:DDE-domain-containing protein, partial [Sistotremastrum suecicum HHB10207 ss-3]